MNRPRSKVFSEQLTCFVINLDSRPDRWQRVERNCRRRSISPIRFSAHDGSKGLESFPGSPLSPGELGLWSSFKAVVEATVDTEWILVLEDDAILLPGFRRHASREIRRAGAEVISIRMGWIGPFAWRFQTTVSWYLRTLPRRVLGDVKHRVRTRFKRGGATRPRPMWGTHALLLRPGASDRLLGALGEARFPLDQAFTSAEWSHPDLFIRSKRNGAWQWPDESNIRADWAARLRSAGWSEDPNP